MSNPINCITTWVGDLMSSPTPAYQDPPKPPATPAPTPVIVPAVARVRAIAVTRAPGLGTTDGGPIAELTLVVDDDSTAALVVEALHTGAVVRVVAASCG